MSRADVYDLIIVGGGVAGLYAALSAADEADVLVLSKGPLHGSSSYYAQGGVAAALADDDDPELHAEDTLRAGRGLCRESAVEAATAEAPARIADLVELGVVFDEGLGREGGHSRRRIAHAGGAETGKRIAEALAERVRTHPRITVSEGERVLALWPGEGRCAGVVTDRRAVAGRGTLLATGGYAALWERTTNPPGAVGEGLALAYRAGAALADLELMQFHPTALVDDGFLLSEALRGEGALLLDEHGERFTDELAPRDVVARAILGRGHVRLDLRGIERERFPGLIATLERGGYEPDVKPIPVYPAAHYSIGGIVTDLDGRTTLPGLYAAGECACTGLHGANRLASNSLLECLVFGRRAGLAALREPAAPASTPPPAPDRRSTVTEDVRRALWRDAGLIRDVDGLERLRKAPLLLARLVAESALAREESRGVHFRVGPSVGRLCLSGPSRRASGPRVGARSVELTAVPAMDERALARAVAAALEEDIGAGDRTTAALVAVDRRCRAQLLLEEPGVVSGLPAAQAVFQALDAGVRFEPELEDGTGVRDVPAVLATVEGSARAILTGERTALNFVARLSGVATLTRRFVELVEGTGTTILDTRKTTPGLRALEKYAVRCGGGRNHRLGLHDAVLVKENHLRIAGGIGPALAALRAAGVDLPIEVEAETTAEVQEALAAGAERILLDNMSPEDVARAVELTAGRAQLEVSGGISLATVRAYAETGAESISVGALTHSARSLRVSLDVE